MIRFRVNFEPIYVGYFLKALVAIKTKFNLAKIADFHYTVVQGVGLRQTLNNRDLFYGT